MSEARRLIDFVASVQRLLRALPPGAEDPRVRVLAEGLATEARWAMLVAERLQREEDDGR